MNSIGQLLDRYCLARKVRDTKTQLEVADKIVDEEVPSLIQRLAQFMMDRNERS
jgi:hypothetical protein